MTHKEYKSKSQMKRVEILKAAEKQITREELLAKIDEINRILVFSNNPFEGMDKLYKGLLALRAVVELPIEDNSKPDSFNMNFANRSPNEIAAQCFQWGYATAMNKVIQAIEKELK